MVKAAAGKLGELGGAAAWEQAQAMWRKIAGRFGGDAEVKKAADLVAADPEDEDYNKVLQKALGKKLQTEPDFAAELLGLAGGRESVQEVIALRRSTVFRVWQEGEGRKTVRAEDGSRINGVIQKS